MIRLAARHADRTIELDPADPPFRITLDRPGHPASERELHHSQGRCEQADTDRWRYVFDDEGDRLEVAIAWRHEGPELLGEIHVEHAGPRRVRSVTFPCIEQRVHTFDRLLMASSWGDDIPRPTQTIRQFCDAGGNAKRMGMDYIAAGQDEVVYYYPSIMAMQHMVLYNAASSGYVACYGLDDATRTFHARAAGKYELGLAIRHYPFLSAGRWVSPTCSLAMLGGGWHEAADLYGSHMRPRLRTPERPTWMRRGFHGWIAVMMKREGEPPNCRFADLPRIYREQVAPTGINVLKLSGWCNRAFDLNYPDYRINPELGTAAELKAACEEIRSMGGRVEFYTNMRLVDPDSDYYRAGGDRCLCVDERGEPYIEKYGTSAAFRIACPACPSYREHFAEQVRRMIREYGAGAMQADQTSCNLDYLCFDSSHPHATPATNFLPGLEQTLEHVRRVYRELDEGFYVWGEGCHERFGQFYDVHQGHGEEFTWQIGRSTPEHFSFVYPDALVTGHAKTDLQGLCYSFVQGKPFDVSVPCLDWPGYRELLTGFVTVRNQWPDYFFDGVFRDDEGLDVPGPGRAFRLNHPDGRGVLVNLWQPGAGCTGEHRACFTPPNDASPRAVYPPNATAALTEHGRVEVDWEGPVVSVVFE